MYHGYVLFKIQFHIIYELPNSARKFRMNIDLRISHNLGSLHAEYHFFQLIVGNRCCYRMWQWLDRVIPIRALARHTNARGRKGGQLLSLMPNVAEPTPEQPNITALGKIVNSVKAGALTLA
jgi:hypothetical protein